MTALVSVMNKHAVAIAADSALTITNQYGHKVINSANKIFTLSKMYPVGIMFCGDASFMGTPWEVIIKLYRHKRLGTSPLATVNDYKNDFLKFLRDENFFCSETKQKFNLAVEAHKFFNIIKNIIKAKTGADALDVDKTKYELEVIINDRSPSCECYKSADSKQLYDDVLSASLDVYNEYPVLFDNNTELKECFRSAFANFLRKSNSNIDYSSQLVFVGYGEEEFFPAMRSVNIYWGYPKGNLRFDKYVYQDVAEDNDAAIARFAQTDVINTFINGINPILEGLVYDTFKSYTEEFRKKIADAIPIEPIKKAVENIDLSSLSDTYNKALRKEIQNRFTNPLINSIGSLDKEDMAEMVESLISITHLNRRITTSEEGVGGPVDVAIITKGDGFIWKKRKHYFDPDLNEHFFMNYLNM